MKDMSNLASERLYIRPLCQDDASPTYAEWLNDPLVNRFLEIRHQHHSVESCRQFIESMNNDPAHQLFGIFLAETDDHIGNIKIGFINQRYGSAELSLFIGSKDAWGKGYATEAIRLATRHAFEDLQLWRVEAGCYSENLASLKAFMKSGYTVEGFFRKNVVLDNKRQDCFWLGLLKNEWK